MAQQKQRKQLHLTDDKNIFTYCFQSLQRLQLNSKTYAMRNFMYTKHNVDNLHTATTTYTTQFYQSYIANNKPNKHNPNNQNNDINVGFTTTQSLCSYNWDSANSGVFIFKFQPISKNSYSTNFVHAIYHQFVHIIIPEKPVRGLMNNLAHFIHPYMNLLPFLMIDCQYSFWVFTLKKSTRRER